jgi:hypothetical protein
VKHSTDATSDLQSLIAFVLSGYQIEYQEADILRVTGIYDWVQHIQFPKRCVLHYLELWTMDKVLKASDSEGSVEIPNVLYELQSCSNVTAGGTCNNYCALKGQLR